MRVVIVGAGQAAASVAGKLRALGHDAPVTIVGAEPVAPYQRPPLSKGYLLGEMPLDRLTLRAAGWWDEAGITLRLSEVALAADPQARTLTTDRGEIGWDALVLATGASPRRLPAAIGGDLPGVHVVRSLADIDRLAPDLAPGRRLVVIGGGYIGLEAAAVARKLGLEVTVVEAAPRILRRVASEPMADLVRALHAGQGVVLREGTGLARIEGDARVTGVVLADGSVLPADVVVVGIGVVPETALAAQAGCALDNGIAVDTFGRTTVPGIWAAGDCASLPWGTGRMRLESVGNAIDMGEAVAANLLGAETPYVPAPWFWSDQFDVKLQIAGLLAGADRLVTRAAGGGTSVWAFAEGRLVCVEALDDPRAYMVGKRLIETGKAVTPEQVADPAVELKALLR